MGSINLLSMAVSIILTQKSSWNRLLDVIWVKEANIDIRDKNSTYLVVSQSINNQLKDWSWHVYLLISNNCKRTHSTNKSF